MVGTDGHRLALAELTLSEKCLDCQIIVPRKTIAELAKLLKESDEDDITVELRKNCFRVLTSDIMVTSRLIEGRFPNYKRVLPENLEKELMIDRDIFKQALSRVMILSNDKYRGIRIKISKNTLGMIANNLEQEEAEEELEVEYKGNELKMGVNASYLLDILSAIPEGPLKISFSNANSSMVLQSLADQHNLYMVMPMKL